MLALKIDKSKYQKIVYTPKPEIVKEPYEANKFMQKYIGARMREKACARVNTLLNHSHLIKDLAL